MLREALGAPWMQGRNFCGQTLVQLSDRFAEIAAERGVAEVLVSLSYDGDYAVAIAALREI